MTTKTIRLTIPELCARLGRSVSKYVYEDEDKDRHDFFSAIYGKECGRYKRVKKMDEPHKHEWILETGITRAFCKICGKSKPKRAK